MVTGLICTDRKGKIQDSSNPEIWEEIYDAPENAFAKGRNIKDVLFQTELFKTERVRKGFTNSLDILVTGEKPRMLIKKGETTTEVYFLYGQFFFITDQIASSYLEDAERVRDLIVNPLVTGGLLVQSIINLCNSPKPNLETIKAKATAARREIRLAERLNYDIPIIESLAHARYEPFPQKINLNDGVFDPIKDMFNLSYGERKISIKYDASLDEEVQLTADRAGMLFIMRALFTVPVINSRVHNFRKFYVSYGHERTKKDGRDMHAIIYWAEWPFEGLSDKEKEKILNTREHATSKNKAARTEVPHIGLKYSRNIALRHGGDIEIRHNSHEKPRPTTEFRLYLPVDMKKEKRLNIDSQK